MADECRHANGNSRAAGKRLSAWTNGGDLREASRALLAKSRDGGQAEIEGPRMRGVQDDNAFGAGEEAFPATSASFISRLHPEDQSRIEAALQAHLSERTPYDVEYRLQHQSGTYLWFHARGQASWARDGRPVRFTGALREITDRKNSEAAAQRTREFLDAVLNAIPQPVFVKDTEHRWIEFNDAFCEVMGGNREALRGHSDFDVFPQALGPVRLG